jgi:hypothetical protein
MCASRRVARSFGMSLAEAVGIGRALGGREESVVVILMGQAAGGWLRLRCGMHTTPSCCGATRCGTIS